MNYGFCFPNLPHLETHPALHVFKQIFKNGFQQQIIKLTTLTTAKCIREYAAAVITPGCNLSGLRYLPNYKPLKYPKGLRHTLSQDTKDALGLNSIILKSDTVSLSSRSLPVNERHCKCYKKLQLACVTLQTVNTD